MTRVADFPVIFVSSFLLLIGVFIASGAQAETLQAKEQQLDVLYTQMLANPADEDATLAYAELAVELGDYEAAIAPLERLLLANPGVPKLKLEIGILYYLLGSHDTAKTYLQEAKIQGSAQPEIITQADEYLQKM